METFRKTTTRKLEICNLTMDTAVQLAEDRTAWITVVVFRSTCYEEGTCGKAGLKEKLGAQKPKVKAYEVA